MSPRRLTDRPEDLSPDEREALARLIGEHRPLSLYALRSGTGRVYVSDDPPGIETAVVEELPREFAGYGEPEPLAALLTRVPDWGCVEVDTAKAPLLGDLLERHLGIPVRHYGSINYVLTTEPVDASHPWVRELTMDDLDLVRESPFEIADAAALLEVGIAAGAVVDRRLVSIASCIARTGRQADVGIDTLEEFRGQGLASAAAVLVTRRLRREGQIPVWGAGEDNWASRRVAEKIGFAETARGCYLIPSWPR